MRSARLVADLKRLHRCIDDDRLQGDEREAFDDMARKLAKYSRPLTELQSQWVTRVMHRLELDVDEPTGPEFASGKIPAGAPVGVPDVLKVLPKRPPGRRPGVA